MKLLLIGHTERYPVEQLQMQLFPDEPSEFVTHRFTGRCRLFRAVRSISPQRPR